MKAIKVRFQRQHKDAKIPYRGSEEAAGWDLTAAAITHADTRQYIEYDTGISVEIPKGYVGLLFQRSSVSKTDMSLRNAVGVIDSDYRGTIRMRYGLARGVEHASMYKVGDRIGQLMIMPFPQIEWVEVKEGESLLSTARQLLGFGSSGK